METLASTEKTCGRGSENGLKHAGRAGGIREGAARKSVADLL